MDLFFQALFDIFAAIPSGGRRGGRRRAPLIPRLGLALVVVMVGLGCLAGVIMGQRIAANEPSAIVPLMLVPFGGTALAGAVGEAPRAQWLAAATVSAGIAILLAIPVGIALTISSVA
jgi:drug/metabolite transporter (DMT)-like permease